MEHYSVVQCGAPLLHCCVINHVQKLTSKDSYLLQQNPDKKIYCTNNSIWLQNIYRLLNDFYGVFVMVDVFMWCMSLAVYSCMKLIGCPI